MSKFAAFLIILAITLSACGSSSSNKPSSLTGTWKSSDPPMVAHISHGKIEIDIVDEGDSSLYWKGTLDATASEGSKLVSKGDVKAMGESILGSQDATKEFVYKDGKLTYRFTIMGTTKIVKLER